MKTIIKQIYYIIPTENFFIFIQEAEFRIKIKNFNTQSKMNEFIDIINYIKNIDLINLFIDNYLISITE